MSCLFLKTLTLSFYLFWSHQTLGLRVGAQVFEQLTVQPLQDAVSGIVESKTALLELAAKADSLAQQIQMTYDGVASLSSSSSTRPGGIKISSTKDVRDLMNAMS